MKVKNKFWLTTCLLAFFSLAKAQNHVHLIVFGGFNSSYLVTDFKDRDIILSEAKQHYNFGAACRFEFAKILYLQPEVYFTRKGGLEKAFRSGVSGSLSQQADVQSVDVPLMFGFRFFDSDRFSLRMYGGPVLSFLEDYDVDVLENERTKPWYAVVTKPNVFSMQVGAGFDITRRFTFDAHYEYAFSPMFTFADFKTSYRIIYFTLGLKLF